MSEHVVKRVTQNTRNGPQIAATSCSPEAQGHPRSRRQVTAAAWRCP
eukprot:CAMPEP_0183574476 /NCGR_PEP_ID=MMETSP0371-20130417/133450_1 /TAXON_ID=268820 /ORGANISM="Peridinium aciculiferum, Strain PAER-2" /LENGTH=46 /DNA_ID= /DNA_START= /DNA_END= /DNA_ORIENTATION=